MGEVVLEVSCRVCPGLIDRVPRGEVARIARVHHAQVHPHRRRPVEGVDYTAAPAALVCDACLTVVELPWWEHASTPPTSAGGGTDRDGRWILCDRCHDLRAGRALSGWVRRAWAVHLQRAPWPADGSPDRRADVRAEPAGTLRLLLERLDHGHRAGLG